MVKQIAKPNSSRFHQGRFVPKYPSKYVGDVNQIWYRSSWELKALNYLDNNPSILKYNSEENIIHYMSPVDRKVHRYFVDLTIQFKTLNNEIKNAIVEIKPLAQTRPPKLPLSGRQTKRYLNEQITYAVNTAKWNAASAWAAANNFEFYIWSEKELGL